MNQKEIRRLEALCKAYAGNAARTAGIMRYQRRLEKLVAESEKIRQRTQAAIARFYPAVLASAEGFVRLPYFRWLQIDGAELVSEWIVDMAESNFRGYDIRRPFFCYGLFTLRRRCGNIARRESCRRCKAIPESTSCEDDPSAVVQVVEEYEAFHPFFCQLPNEVQEIFVRKYCLDESSDSIGAEFSMSAAQIDRLTWRYRLELRKMLSASKRWAA